MMPRQIESLGGILLKALGWISAAIGVATYIAAGGVNLILRGNDRTSLVRCKQWKVFFVGAPVVHEMFGLMTPKHADQAIVVTSGKFTRDPQDFAVGKTIRLIDGHELLVRIQLVQIRHRPSSMPPPQKAAILRKRKLTIIPWLVRIATSQWCYALLNVAPTPGTSSGAAPAILPARGTLNLLPQEI